MSSICKKVVLQKEIMSIRMQDHQNFSMSPENPSHKDRKSGSGGLLFRPFLARVVSLPKCFRLLDSGDVA